MLRPSHRRYQPAQRHNSFFAWFLCVTVNLLGWHRVCTGMTDFDGFYAQHQQRLIRLCWLLTLDRDASIDLAQESMTRAWREWEKISSDGSNPVAWTNRVAANLSSNYRRRHGTRRRWQHLFNRPEVAAPVTEHVDLAKSLAKLSSRQRQAIVLRYWEDLDLAGCADVMGVSVGSVKTHLSRAHDALRQAGELAMEDER